MALVSGERLHRHEAGSMDRPNDAEHTLTSYGWALCRRLSVMVWPRPSASSSGDGDDPDYRAVDLLRVDGAGGVA
jgi:hypothetical protein